MNRLMSFRGKFLPVRVELALLRITGILTRHAGYRGIGTLSKLLNRIFDNRNSAVVRIGKNSRVNVYLGDYYWSRLIFDDYEYEPDLKFALRKVMTSDSCFIDCGANIGYWSILASECVCDPRRVVAVEAAADTYRRLTENCELNGRRFTCVRAAIAERSGQTLDFAISESHAGAHLTAHGRNQPGEIVESVRSTTIDDLCGRYLEGFSGRMIIKIDVEGAEIAALTGAARSLKHEDVAIVYEDHSSDLESTTTKYVLTQLGMRVYFMYSNDFAEVSDVDHLLRIKKAVLDDTYKKEIGFNLLAVHARSPLNRVLAPR